MIQFFAHESVRVQTSNGTIWIDGEVANGVKVALFIDRHEAFALGRQLLEASGLSEPNIEQVVAEAQARGELPS